MSQNLKSAAFAAQLSPEQKAQIDNFVKQQNVHKELLNLPQGVANKSFNAKTPEEQQSLIKTYGTEDQLTKPNRGWMGTALHYAKNYNPITLAFKGFIEGSDLSTRAFRTLSIAGDQNVSLFGKGNAWDIANDNGDKVYSPNRIDKAKTLYGNDAITVAMRIASGEPTAEILASVTDSQKKYVMFADPLNKVIPGVTDIEQERALFQDALELVKSAKYSPGRFVANIVDRVTPGSLVNNGFMWTAISGAVDTAYRLFADPTVIGAKIRGMYMFSRYALEIVTGGTGKVAETFAKTNVKAFWDDYGPKLDNYARVQKSGTSKEQAIARKELKTVAPEFGTGVIKILQKADVKDARSAEAFFLNIDDSAKMFKGAVGRRRVLMPRLDGPRKARIAIVTGTNTGIAGVKSVFNLDKFGPSILNDLMGAPVTTDGILKLISDEPTKFGAKIRDLTVSKGWLRLPSATIAMHLDKAKAKFSIAPLFKNDRFDVTAKDAGDKIYQSARMIMTELDARMFREAFESTDDVGKRKEIFKGIWNTVFEARGLNFTESGRKIISRFNGDDSGRFAVAGERRNIGALPSDFNPTMTAPSLADIDIAASRAGIIDRMMGQANKEWVNKMTGVWSYLTLAGYRYAIRNAGEDLMVHLAIGGSPWGIVTNRQIATRLNTAQQGLQFAGGPMATAKTALADANKLAASATTPASKAAATAAQVVAKKKFRTASKKAFFASDSPLGLALRFANRKEAHRYADQFMALDDIHKTANTDIIKLKGELKLATDDVTKASIATKIANLRETIEGGIVGQTRRIMATALTEGRVNRWRGAVGLKPMNKKDADVIAEHLIYGNLENTLAEVSESAINNGTLGSSYLTLATNFVRKHGKSEPLVINTPTTKNFRVDSKKDIDAINVSSRSEESLLTWAARIGYVSNDDLGRIVVANLNDEKLAIIKIKQYMNDNPNFRKDARMEAEGVGEQEHAEIVFARIREVFETRRPLVDGKRPLNNELLNKIRSIDDKTGEMVVSGRLSLDDLPQDSMDIPEQVLGLTLIPVSEGNMTASLMNRGWTWLGLSNARLSRQPMVFNEILELRKQMRVSGFEAKYLASFTSKLDNPTPAKLAQATAFAKREFAQLVEERAVSQILQYVDNPLVRTQLAFGARNFARFYRATEDFYRRVYRTVRYNPMAIRKAALTYEGITHGGFIQKDDQGEAYFVYPAVEPVYRVIQAAMTALGVPAEFKVPFPVQFGAQVKMLTPSLNQDSIIPTFSGPLSGISMKVITNLIGWKFDGTADNITQMTMGKYAVDQPFVSAFLPAHVNRLLAAMDEGDRDGQYASAWRKSVTYLEAGGHGLPKNLDADGNLIPNTPAELEEYRLKIKNTTLAILGTRFFYSFFAPASPQVQLKADMATWVKDNGSANFKQVFNKLTDQYAGDYDKAMARWIELFPNELPFTVSESERKTVAVLRYAEESGTFVENNQDLFKQYPQGAAFLIPHKSGFSWDAYKTMTKMGLKGNKTVDEYLRDVQTAADLQTYYAKKNDYEKGLGDMFGDSQRSAARKEFTEWATLFKLSRPLLQIELAEGGKKAVARIQAIDDLRRMLSDSKFKNVRGPTQRILNEMLGLYDSYKEKRLRLEERTGNSDFISRMKDDLIIKLRKLSESNENTKSAYFTLFSSLLGDTNG